jgi:hypothetical protein
MAPIKIAHRNNPTYTVAIIIPKIINMSFNKNSSAILVPHFPFAFGSSITFCV